MLFLARSRKEVPREREEEATGEPSAAASPKKKQKTRAARRFTGEDRSKKSDDGKYSHNKKGIEICRLFNFRSLRITESPRTVQSRPQPPMPYLLGASSGPKLALERLI